MGGRSTSRTGVGRELEEFELEFEFEFDLDVVVGHELDDDGRGAGDGIPAAAVEQLLAGDTRLPVTLVLGAILALFVGAALETVHAGSVGEVPTVVRWLRDATLGWPVATGLLVLCGRLLGDRPPRDVTAWLQRGLTIAAAYASLLVPAALGRAWLLATPGHGGTAHVVREAAAVVGPAAAVLLVFGTLLGWAPVDGRALIARRAAEVRGALTATPIRRPLRTRALSTLLSGSLVLSLVPTTAAVLAGVGAQPADAAVPACTSGTVDREYDVAAIDVILPFNRWGDVDKHGQIYVLEQDRKATQYWWAPLGTDGNGDPGPDIADNRRLRPRPLVLRANEGECVRVDFTNRIDGQAPVPPDAPAMARPNVPPQNEGLPTQQHASIHVHGPSYDVVTSDGSHVGFNEDTTVGPGQSITYYWRAPSTEGLYLFHDHATLAGSEADAGSNGHGLFGALAVEPAGSEWYDPVSNARLDTGTTPYMDPVTRAQSGELYLNAIIVPPAPAVAFREFVQISQDEVPGQHLQEADLADRGLPKTFDFGIGLGFNYGLEPLLMRQEPINRCPDCVGEETWLSSWPYGDPGLVKLASGLGPWYPSWHPFFPGNDGVQVPGRTADPEDCGLESVGLDGGLGAATPAPWASCYTSSVVHAYQFDATKIRYAHAGPKETHVFHLHAHQWLRDPRDIGASGATPGQPDDDHMPESTTIDSQTFGPGETFTADILFGAGSKPGTIGDSIFHCHLYPHFAEGFWALWRVHDVLEDGTGTTPDGVKVVAIQPLPGGTTPAGPDEFAPGYPRFIPGQYGWRAPQPLNGVSEPGGEGVPTSDVLDFVDADLNFARRHVAGTGLDETLLDATQTVTLTADPPVSEVQVVTILGTVDGGSLQLGYGGTWTGPIPWNADGPAVAAAVNAAFTSWTVTGAGAPGGPWTLTWSTPADDIATLATQDALTYVGAPAGSLAVSTVTHGDPGGLGGHVTLAFGGETTAPIAHDASSADVESALEALNGVADVAVSGPDGGPWDVTLLLWSETGSLEITADGSGLSAGTVAVTRSRDDLGDPAIADVAYRLARERANALAIQNPGFDPGPQPIADASRQPRPGAPLVDPCPDTAREVTYNVSVIQLDIVYNEAGWHDTQGRILVLDEDVDAVLSGQKAPEPFFFRVNAGDCINFNLTNRLPNWLGNDDFLQLIQTNMVGEHIHLVKFDVTASDGASNGWNYQQAAYSEDQRLFDDGVLAGTQGCGADGFNGLELTHDGCRVEDPDWFNPQWSCASAATCPVGQTIHERWYADYELRTVFTHDHHFPAEDQNRGYFAALIVEPAGMDVRNSFTGEYMQPRNMADACGSSCEGNAVGTHVDVIGPGPDDDFREYGIGIQDFVSLYRACQPGGEPCSSFIPGEEPLAPPEAPEAYPDDDPGVFGINYRNAPFLLRNDADPAYVFSSRVHGDPETPLLQAYAGDKVRVRVIQGSQEEQHVLQLHGMRWREEPDDPGSPLMNAQAVGVSEAFNFEIPEMECSADPKEDCRGDYLYSGTSTDDLWLGAWGLLRVFGKGVKGLLPLPDNIPPAVGGNTSFSVSGEPPPKAHKPGQPCPTDAPVRAFDVIAVDAAITYNHYGDHDPYGLVYAVVEPGETVEEAAARVRSSNPEPMVLRANEGDCIEVTLTNMIDPDGDFATVHGPVGAQQSGQGFDPPLVLESPSGTPAGLRVSLHPQLLLYDVRYSDGATIGHNRDQTVGPRSPGSEPGSPGESITYRWWADDVTPKEIGAINLTDYGDVRGHRHHGLFAGLVIGPAGSTYHDPYTGEEVLSAGQVDVRTPGEADYRDAALFFQDGLNLWDVNGDNIADPFDHPPADGEPGVLADAEDRGEKGFSYRNAPFARRLGIDPPGSALDGLPGATIADVHDSHAHGDPDTPIIRAYAGDPLRVRLLQGADKPRQHSFQLSGHGWLRQPFDDPGDTETIGTIGGFSVNRAVTIDLVAGGAQERIGDHRYNCGVLAHHQSGGLWGITRIYDPPDLAGAQVFTPTALDPESPDDPRLGGTPLMPLEFTQVKVGVYGDGNTDGQRGNNEGPKAGIWVDVYGGDPDPSTGDYTTALDRRQTDDDGYATFQVAPGAYDVVLPVTESTEFGEVRVLVDHDPTTPTRYRADATTQAERPYGEFGVIQLADVTIDVFEDLDGDNLHEAHEDPLGGWEITLSKGAVSHTGTTGPDGLVTIDGLWPGTWTTTIVAQGGRVSSRDQDGNGEPDRVDGTPFTIDVSEDASLTPAPSPQTDGDPKDLNAGFTFTTGVKVVLFNDAYPDGVRDADEGPLVGWRVELLHPNGSPVLGAGGPLTATTDASGSADLGDEATGGDHLVRVVPPHPSWGPTTVTTVVTPTPAWAYDGSGTCTGNDCSATYVYEPLVATSNVTTIGMHTDTVWIVAEPFNDTDNDNVRDGNEKKLVGWKAELVRGGTVVDTMTTGNDGRAVFEHVLGPMGSASARGSYAVRFTQPVDADLDWAPTPATTTPPGGAVEVSVSGTALPGETVTTKRGFIQLGTVSVQVFHDLDGDGAWDGDEPPLANRNVRLLSRNGKTVLQTGATKSDGMRAFQVAAGTEYRLEVLTSSGWVATAPKARNGEPTTVASVVSSSDPMKSTDPIEFGQRQLNDTTPPPDPVANPAGGSFTGPQNVSLTSESGATIRYTTDGTTPTAASSLYTGPVTIGVGSTTLKAIAIDAAGNVSGVTTQIYEISGSGGGGSDTTTVWLDTWQVEKGTQTSGTVGDLQAVDGQMVVVDSARKGKRQAIWADGTANTEYTSVTGLVVSVNARSSLASTTLEVELFDHAAGTWRKVGEGTVGLSVGLTEVTPTSAADFVSSTGDIRVRLVAERRETFTLRIDRVEVEVTYPSGGTP